MINHFDFSIIYNLIKISKLHSRVIQLLINLHFDYSILKNYKLITGPLAWQWTYVETNKIYNLINLKILQVGY